MPINVTPHHPHHGVRWGRFALAGFTMPQGWGSDLHANLLHIPHLAPTGAQSKQRKLCYMSRKLCYMSRKLCYMSTFCCLLKNTNVSNAPPLGQQTADKSPHNPLPYPVLGVVGRDNDRRITRTILSCCPLHNIIYSVLATTCPFYTKNRCSHTPIALAVFRTKLFRTLQSRETHIGVGGLWGGRDWEEMAFFGALEKEMYLLPSLLLVGNFCQNRVFSLNIRPSVTYRQRPF